MARNKRSSVKSISKGSSPNIVFTIVSNNYFAYAATLMESVARHMPDTQRIVYICDEINEQLSCSAEIRSVSAAVGANLFDMVIRYSILEINTAVKPYIIMDLLDKGAVNIIYLDPDICLYGPLDEVTGAFRDGYDLVLTPHITGPLQDGKHPNDHEIMSTGVWNCGFAAFRRSPDVYSLVTWWRDKCAVGCLVDLKANMFTDQRWMDMGPAFVERTKIIHHLGYNVAYWNLHQRSVRKNNSGQWMVNEKFPLCFYHFSGLVPANPEIISKHQDRYQAKDLPKIKPLFDEYRAVLTKHGWWKSRSLSYAWQKTPTGRVIPDMGRLIFRRLHPTSVGERFDSVGAALTWFSQWLDELAEEAQIPITRLMLSIFELREDLEAAFNLSSPTELREFHRWFETNAKQECHIDEVSLAAARRVIAAPIVAEAAQAANRMNDWRSFIDKLSATVFDPPFHPVSTANLIGWMSKLVDLSDLGVSIKMPLGFLLPMLVRDDVMEAFPLLQLKTVFDYLYWVFTSGAKEGFWNIDLSNALFPAIDPEIRAFDRNTSGTLGAGLSPFVIMAFSKYDGRFGFGNVDPWKHGDAMSARLAYALLVEFRGAAFPSEVTEVVQRRLEQPVQMLYEKYDVIIPRVLFSIWSGRADLKTDYPGNSSTNWLGLLGWYLSAGRSEYFSDEQFGLGAPLLKFLQEEWPECEQLRRIHAAIYYYRPDLRAMMDINSAGGKNSYRSWLGSAGVIEYSKVLALTAGQANSRNAVADVSLRSSKLLVKGPADPIVGADKAIAVVGYFSAPSGRGEDARTLSQSLAIAGFRVTEIDRGGTAPESLDIDESCTCIHVLNADTTFQDYVWSTRLRNRLGKNVGYWAWELSEFPAAWKYAFAFYDEVWGISEFGTLGLQKQEYRQVQTLPNAVRPAEKGALAMPIEVEDGVFCFFFSFDFSSYVARKNPEGVVRAFMKAFPEGNEPVQLLIKSIGGDERPDALSSLLDLCDGDGRIVIIDGHLAREEVDGLFARSDAYVSLHRAEGFGRGIAEAMLQCKPVIVTGYSGSNEFCDASNSFPVKYSLTKIQPNEYVPAAVGLEWAEPDVHHAATQLRAVFERKRDANEIAMRGRMRIARDFSVQANAERLKVLLTPSKDHETAANEPRHKKQLAGMNQD
jgi:glycosyltransferase involved in cell wall biosynthesis